MIVSLAESWETNQEIMDDQQNVYHRFTEYHWKKQRVGAIYDNSIPPQKSLVHVK